MNTTPNPNEQNKETEVTVVTAHSEKSEVRASLKPKKALIIGLSAAFVAALLVSGGVFLIFSEFPDDEIADGGRRTTTETTAASAEPETIPVTTAAVTTAATTPVTDDPLATIELAPRGESPWMVEQLLEPSIDVNLHLWKWTIEDFMLRAGVGSHTENNVREGILDGRTGEVVVPLIYDSVSNYQKGFALVNLGAQNFHGGGALDGKFGLVNTNGEVVVPIVYDRLGWWRWTNVELTDGLIAVGMGGNDMEGWTDGRFGFVNMNGEVVIPLEYSSAWFFSEGFASVGITDGCCCDTKYGVINTQGEVVVPFIYDRIGEFSNGLAPVSLNEITDGRDRRLTGFIDTRGELVIPFEYHSDGGFDENGLAVVYTGDWNSATRGVINTRGEVVVPLEYNSIGGFVDGVAIVRRGERWGTINTRGEVVIPLGFDAIVHFSEELGAVRIGEKWGFINTSGDVVIPAMFDWVGDFRNGYAAVSVGDCWSNSMYGFIDTQGRLAVPMIYNIIGGTHGVDAFIPSPVPVNGVSIVGVGDDWEGRKFGLVDVISGETVVPLEYDNIIYVGSENGREYFWANKDGLWGIYVARRR
jgi:hypothetical protein